MKRGIILLACLVLVAATSPNAWAGESTGAIPIIPNDGSAATLPIMSPNAACNLSNAVPGGENYFNGEYQVGDVIVTYIDPNRCGPPFVDLFQVTEVSFMLGTLIPMGDWPVSFDIVIYVPADVDICYGPGQEMYRQSIICDQEDFLGRIGTVTLDPGFEATGPFFVGLEWTYTGPPTAPIIVYDDQNSAACYNWLYRDGGWQEWTVAWGQFAPGNPLIWVHGDTPQQECWAAADVNNDGIVLSVSDYVYLVRYLNGEVSLEVPYQADLNGDCIVDYLDVLVYEDYFERGLPAFAPWGDYPVPTCCNPDLTHGACCIDNSACQVLHPTNCQTALGEYWGDGTTCSLTPGDANGDGGINIGDAVYLIGYLDKGGPAPTPYGGNGDPNGDGCVGHDDVAFIICIGASGGELQPVACTNPDAQICEWDNCLPGDANYDLDVNVADAIFIINMVFKGGPLPQPYGILSGDANGDATTDIGDAVYVINYVFNGGAAPPTCGEWFVMHPCVDPHYGSMMYPLE